MSFFSEAGELNYLAVGYPLTCMFPLTRRFAPRWSAQTKVVKRPSPSFVNVEIYWTSLCESRIPSHDFYPSFLIHHPFTILLMKPLPQAQTRVLAAGARTEESHPRTHVPPPHHRILSRSPLDRRKDGTTRSASSPLQAGVKGQGVFQMHHCGGSPQRNLASERASG